MYSDKIMAGTQGGGPLPADSPADTIQSRTIKKGWATRPSPSLLLDRSIFLLDLVDLFIHLHEGMMYNESCKEGLT